MRTLILLVLLGSIVFVSCGYKDTDAEGFLEDLVKRLLEEKQNERRLEKERQGKAREEKKGSNKLLYELEKILKRQDPDCKSKDVDCDHWNQCCSQKCVLQLGHMMGKCEE